MKAIEKVQKKAWKEIAMLKTAGNMLDVESLVATATLKTFGLLNLGILKIRMKDDLVAFEVLKERRQRNLEIYGQQVKDYLLTFVPGRFGRSRMYQEFINQSVIRR